MDSVNELNLQLNQRLEKKWRLFDIGKQSLILLTWFPNVPGPRNCDLFFKSLCKVYDSFLCAFLIGIFLFGHQQIWLNLFFSLCCDYPPVDGLHIPLLIELVTVIKLWMAKYTIYSMLTSVLQITYLKICCRQTFRNSLTLQMYF